MVIGLADLKSALSALDFDRLLGTPEDTWVDFKSEPYRLDTFKGRWEYVKDVAALANAGGGCIVLGVKTGRPPNELASVAESWAQVPKRLVDLKQHADALSNGVFPEVWGVGMSWYPADKSVESGLLLIEVPSQRTRDKPFVMRSMLGPEDRQTVALGIPVRNGSETLWLKAERLHPLLAGALVGDTLDTDQSLPARRIERAREVIQTITRENNWAEEPVLFLQGLPPPGRTVLADLHAPEGVLGLMRAPPVRRALGFNLGPAGAVTARDGGLARIDSRKALILERDGTLTAAGVAGPAFLCWGMNIGERSTGPYDLNATALVEYVYEFFRFAYLVVAPRAVKGRWTFRVVANGWRSRRGGVCLAPGPPNPYRAWPEDAQLASGDQLEDEIEGSGLAERDAFVALDRIYGLFGLPSNVIPFTSGGAVLEELLPK